ncbi:hypothetical protein NRK67_00615 [Fusobacteria bacterium ZRK30]|nr:hypothetical protein NRK67_00615 [Fusobacteria bacterium ZRK30]
MQLQEFINKARARKDNEVKVIKIEIKDIGAVEFTRPDNKKILEYMEKADKEDLSVTEMFGLTKEMLYLNCPVLQKKEVREEFKPNNPYDLVTDLFGIHETTDIMEKFMKGFGLDEEEKKNEEEIKN